jgi:hypothetical protein
MIAPGARLTCYSLQLKAPVMRTLSPFQLGYLTCALWSTNDESNDSGGNPLDDSYTIDDIDPNCLDALCAECNAFETANQETIAGAEITLAGTDSYATNSPEREQAGHDFWLTRNGHGVGFWDGDYSEPHATLLTAASEAFGTIDLYVGDDGKIYASGMEG